MISTARKAYANPWAAYRKLLFLTKLDRCYNRVIDLTSRRPAAATGFAMLDQIRERSRHRTDVSDHLVTLFVETLVVRPNLVVELGVRRGESTFALEKAAELCGAVLVSVDIEPIAFRSPYERWISVECDDLEFARSFPAWCADRGLAPQVDVLFVDTSHSFEHTLGEIRAWFPHLSSTARVFFHDTNLVDVYRHEDGSIGLANNGRRGVMAAIEEYLGVSYDEGRPFVDSRDGWLIRHQPHCSGLTILDRI